MADRRDRPRGAPPRSSQTREPSDAPHHSPRTQADKAARAARLAAEMRKNLQKRKRQQRARDGRTPQGD